MSTTDGIFQQEKSRRREDRPFSSRSTWEPSVKTSDSFERSPSVTACQRRETMTDNVDKRLGGQVVRRKREGGDDADGDTVGGQAAQTFPATHTKKTILPRSPTVTCVTAYGSGVTLAVCPARADVIPCASLIIIHISHLTALAVSSLHSSAPAVASSDDSNPLVDHLIRCSLFTSANP